MLGLDHSAGHSSCFTDQDFLKPCVQAGEMLLLYLGLGLLEELAGILRGCCVLGLQDLSVLCVSPANLPHHQTAEGEGTAGAGMRR